MSSSTAPCRFFLSGTCRYGSNCRYSHSTTSTTTTSVGSNIPSKPSGSTSNNPGPVLNALKWLNAPEFVPKASQPAKESAGALKKQQKKKTPSAATAFALDDHGDTPDPHLRIIDDDEDEEDVSEDNITVITSYAEMCKRNLPPDEEIPEVTLCPFMARNEAGICVYGDECPYIHGDQCELCGLFCLNPVNEEVRKRHIKHCLEQHEKDMELSFAIARSKDKHCGICMELVIEKAADQRFGILQNCNHVFCLECIRKWRQNKEKQFNNEIARACPECRVSSDFICPSTYWVGDIKEEKDKLIDGYKKALNDKHCKYFKNGEGKCPFGNKCFYKHVDKFNRAVDVGDPKKSVKRYNRNGELEMRDLLLMDVIQSIERLDDSENDDENEDGFLELFHEVYRFLH